MTTADEVTQSFGPVLKTVDTTLVSGLTAPGFFAELGLAVALLVVVIAVHGWCLASISRSFGRRFARFTPETRQWRVSALMASTIALLALTHLFETFIWSVPIRLIGMIPNLRDAYFFVLEAYTTLGEGSVALPHTWRLGGPIIAISGLFTFSWTGSVLVYVMTEIGRRHATAPFPDPQEVNKRKDEARG